jgi:predicted RNA-binding Zn ribbon-like protein
MVIIEKVDKMANLQNSNQLITTPVSVDAIELLGGRLCLDFVNTVDPRLGDHLHDFLTSYSDLVQWSHHAGMLTEEEQQNLSQAALYRPVEAGHAFERAIVLREIVYRIFSSVAHAIVPQKADLDALRDVFAEAMFHTSLVPTTEGFTWHWLNLEDAFDCMLWPIACSAIELLTSAQARKVKQCPGVGDCGWLFLDTSKNGSRLWCSMEGCGSRAKMRRQYARKRVAR